MTSRGLSLSQRGIDTMARMCPLNGSYALYLDCIECDKRFECKSGELLLEVEDIEEAQAGRDRNRPVVQADWDKHSR